MRSRLERVRRRRVARRAREIYAGLIDEVAVYDHVLSPECSLAHFMVGTRSP